jgi:3-isopropylmalate/(R)-2-methylmalate dehydratase small subunit
MDIMQGKVYVLDDNIDTDQIIPAQYLALVPTIPEEYEKLGSYALIGLPNADPPFVREGQTKTEFQIVIAGKNFGCGSSREHAPVALGAAGVKAVVAESFARIFFRNSIATGEIYPIDSRERLCDVFSTGDEAVIDLKKNRIVNTSTGTEYSLVPLGDAKDVIDAGGIFTHARNSGMIT